MALLSNDYYILVICPEVQTGDMKCRLGNGIEGAMVYTSLGSLLRPLFYFLDDVSYPQSVEVSPRPVVAMIILMILCKLHDWMTN